MNKFAGTIIAFCVCTFFVVAADAQGLSKVINGGILNGKAVKLPQPEYPEWARNAKLEGTVLVDVVIDEDGNVESATAASEARKYKQNRSNDLEEARDIEPADQALREAAEKAALEAKFSPTMLSGTPIKVKGTIVYKFTLTSSGLDGDSPGGTVSGGILNGKATSLPLPAYPEAAKAVEAEGAVNVSVVVDENGNVASARAVSGHPLLRAAAVEAAKAAIFAPTRLSGEPVRVSGVITYMFTP